MDIYQKIVLRVQSSSGNIEIFLIRVGKVQATTIIHGAQLSYGHAVAFVSQIWCNRLICRHIGVFVKLELLSLRRPGSRLRGRSPRLINRLSGASVAAIYSSADPCRSETELLQDHLVLVVVAFVSVLRLMCFMLALISLLEAQQSAHLSLRQTSSAGGVDKHNL